MLCTLMTPNEINFVFMRSETVWSPTPFVQVHGSVDNLLSSPQRRKSSRFAGVEAITSINLIVAI
jgi:hypothetical protein